MQRPPWLLRAHTVEVLISEHPQDPKKGSIKWRWPLMEACSNPEQRTIKSLHSTHAYLLNNELLKDL